MSWRPGIWIAGLTPFGGVASDTRNVPNLVDRLRYNAAMKRAKLWGMAGLFLAASIGVGVWLSTRLPYRFLEGAELKEAGMMGDVWPLGARRAMCRWTSPSGNTRSRGMFTR